MLLLLCYYCYSYADYIRLLLSSYYYRCCKVYDYTISNRIKLVRVLLVRLMSCSIMIVISITNTSKHNY